MLKPEAKRGWVVSSTPWPLYPEERDPVPISIDKVSSNNKSGNSRTRVLFNTYCKVKPYSSVVTAGFVKLNIK